MKEKLILLLFFILLLSASCNNKNKGNVFLVNYDSIANIQKDSFAKVFWEDSIALQNAVSELAPTAIDPQKVHYSESKFVDSIIGNYQVLYVTKNNNSIIIQEMHYPSRTDTAYYADKSVYLTIKNKGETILKNKEINKYLFEKCVQGEIAKFEFREFDIAQTSNSSIVFYIFLCVPDTDDYYQFSLDVSNDGILSIKELDGGEMGGE